MEQLLQLVLKHVLSNQDYNKIVHQTLLSKNRFRFNVYFTTILSWLMNFQMKKPDDYLSYKELMEDYWKGRDSLWKKCFMKYVLPVSQG